MTTLFAETGARRSERRGTLANAQAQDCEGADFRSRRRHRCLRFCILQIIGQRSHVDSMRLQLWQHMLGIACACAEENMENIIEELHMGPWRTELVRECTRGSLVPLVQSAKDFNKLQRYLSGNLTVNGAKLEFHAYIKLHLQKAIFFPGSGSWGCLKYICRRVASFGVEIWTAKGKITSTAWKNSSGTQLLQLQQSHLCDLER